MSTQVWPHWYRPGDCAEADSITRDFVADFTDHQKLCETCKEHGSCKASHELVDLVDSRIKAIGDAAFARFVKLVEAKYAHTDY